MAVFAAEGSFRTLLLHPMVPRTARQFQRSIAARWPHPIPVSKPAGRFRVIGLSDSFGVAGEERNFHYLLEDALRRRGLDADVVNFSEVEYEPAEELEILERFGPRYEPDLVLHGFFVGNDFALFEGSLRRFLGVSVHTVEGPAAWLPENWLLVRWLPRLQRVLEVRELLEEERRRREPTGFFDRESFLTIERKRLEIFRRQPSYEHSWKEVFNRLDQIRRAALQMGASYVMVVHPDRCQLEAALLDELREARGVKLEDFDLDLPQRSLATYCAERGLQCLDLLPAFREASRAGHSLYAFRDTHYNDAGNALAARTIFSFLTSVTGTAKS